MREYDNFGVPLSLNINKQSEYKSVCGGVLSVMMTVVLIYILISGLIGVFNRDAYTVTITKTILDRGVIAIGYGSWLKRDE